MKAVSNTTPLRYLIAIEQEHLLGKLFEKVFVPVQNGIAERWVESCRRDLLDQVIAMNEAHLKRLPSEYRYFHEDPHLGLKKETPGRRVRAAALGGVTTLPKLGAFVIATNAWRNSSSLSSRGRPLPTLQVLRPQCAPLVRSRAPKRPKLVEMEVKYQLCSFRVGQDFGQRQLGASGCQLAGPTEAARR